LQPDQITVKQTILKIKSLNRYLKSKWKIILLITVIGAISGILYATFKKPVYTAELTFVLDEGNTNGNGLLSQYSSLASMAGLDVNGSSGLFEGDNIIQLYKSKLMLEKTLLTKVPFNGKDELLIDRYIESNNLRKGWDNNPKLRGISFDTLKNKFTVTHDSLIMIIADAIDKQNLIVDKPDKMLSIISVRVKSKDQLFAKAFTETIVANVNKFYIDTKTKSSLKSLQLFQHQSDSIRNALNLSISGSAVALDANPDPDPSLQILKVPSQRKQVDIQAASAMYAEAVKNLEIARSVLQRETPLIQEIDGPMLPLPNDRIGKAKGLIYGAIIAFILVVIAVSTDKLYKKILS
jgi:hypothetical protein